MFLLKIAFRGSSYATRKEIDALRVDGRIRSHLAPCEIGRKFTLEIQAAAARSARARVQRIPTYSYARLVSRARVRGYININPRAATRSAVKRGDSSPSPRCPPLISPRILPSVVPGGRISPSRRCFRDLRVFSVRIFVVRASEMRSRVLHPATISKDAANGYLYKR